MKHLILALFLFLVSLYTQTSGGHTYAPDDESFYYVAESIAARGEFDMPDPWADFTHAVEILPPHAERMTIMMQTLGSASRGASPKGDELGFQVAEVSVLSDGRELEFLPDLSIPPIPLAIPKAAWSWRYAPHIPHFDFWWWYLYFSGLPRPQVLPMMIGGILVALIGMIVAGLTLSRPEEFSRRR